MELANSIVTLQPGIYILRHPQTGMPPISISRAAGKREHNGTVQALYTPGTDGSVLRDGRDCIVMQVLDAPVDLLATAYLERAGVAVPSLKIDKIALDGESAIPTSKRIEVPALGVSIIGHIERIGDSLATEGQRLGDPESSLRLEGFQVMWPNRPEGVDLAYSAHIEGVGPTPTVSAGHFCGTRNAAKRITELTFDLAGPLADQYELQGLAFFSGGYSSAILSGTRVAGPSGLEHLVALDLNVLPSERPSARSKNLWEPSTRTRVMKGSAKRSGGAAAVKPTDDAA